jgi:hypothetical protein
MKPFSTPQVCKHLLTHFYDHFYIKTFFIVVLGVSTLYILKLLFKIFYYLFIHMCIHCLGHFSPLPLPPSPQMYLEFIPMEFIYHQADNKNWWSRLDWTCRMSGSCRRFTVSCKSAFSNPIHSSCECKLIWNRVFEDVIKLRWGHIGFRWAVLQGLVS